ncbi:MAG: Holliday junction branch migration protein RuvA [Chloroherpetonaceae bacterium]|nr:Holliday junction branch migration protein RuvA [Chloroherpetonaceae bacterium]MCS7212021.1 Holliday junction branch migration protein RuvA [Chloroherpetonaceae bacterium]MDW8020725.1 Holliday junction branch migration protein RuvA [Chloroherpetonaceae bacterium]MDW8465711.1 Holliday junction branch migration protein RuvA [Chloroherpetonaceae bacterium]
MLAYLIGTLVEKSPTEATVEVGDLGFSVQISATTYAQLPDLNQRVKLFVHLFFREETFVLYGFASEEERLIFKLLLGVSGIGPKMAQTILSGIEVPLLREAIIGNNLSALTGIAGVGRKTAERIVLELRDKMLKLDLKATPVAVQTDLQQARNDAYSALLALGFAKPSAEKALRAAIAEKPNAKTDELIRLALRHIQK